MIYRKGKILLIKNTYRDSLWNLPGGGIKKKETPEDAVIREVEEETKITINNPTLIGSFVTDREYKIDNVYCFFAVIEDNKVLIDHIEVMDAKWASENKLPSKLSYQAKITLDLYKKFNDN